MLGEKSGPPAWKQLPTWYQISEGDHMIPPDAERLFAKQMNATTLSINSSHASPVSHPEEIAQLILNATKDRSTQAEPTSSSNPDDSGILASTNITF